MATSLSREQQFEQQLTHERQWAVTACRFSPVLGIVCWALAAKYLLFIVFLKPVPTSVDWIQALGWRPAIVAGAFGIFVPWVWWIGINLSNCRFARQFPRFPAAAVFAVCWVCIVCIGISQPKIRWFIVEWAKVRTPNPSFARNTLSWENRDFEQSRQTYSQSTRVGLVGSSQIYSATELDILENIAPEFTFEKNCLAGFGPLQYAWLEERIIERKFDVVVCWLSEFDFFREDRIPVDRLRCSATPKSCVSLWSDLKRPVFDSTSRGNLLVHGENWGRAIDDQWELRGDYADLALAAIIPIWRYRDHIRRTVLSYWWNVSDPKRNDESRVEPQLAESADTQSAIATLRANVGHKRLVDSNFSAFSRFAQHLKDRKIRLIVCEGCSRPDVMSVYDSSLRQTTRGRLLALSRTTGFTYCDETQLPTFTEADFSDPVHLNRNGRDQFSRWLATKLSSIPDEQSN